MHRSRCPQNLRSGKGFAVAAVAVAVEHVGAFLFLAGQQAGRVVVVAGIVKAFVRTVCGCARPS